MFGDSVLVIQWLKKMSDEEGKWKHISTVFKTHDLWLSGSPVNKLSQWAPSLVHCHITNDIFSFFFLSSSDPLQGFFFFLIFFFIFLSSSDPLQRFFFFFCSSSSFFFFLSLFFRSTPPFSYMHKFIPKNKNPHLIFVILVFDLRILGFRFGFSVFMGFWLWVFWWRLWLCWGLLKNRSFELCWRWVCDLDEEMGLSIFCR